MELHPDRCQKVGTQTEEEFQKDRAVATEKFQEVNAAWDCIREARGWDKNSSNKLID
jgi:curved DNA-binding protein CbpA